MINQETNPKGHLFPDSGMGDTRSRSWNTRLLAPAALMASEYKWDIPSTEFPTANREVNQEMYIWLGFSRFSKVEQCGEIKTEGGVYLLSYREGKM